MKRQAAATGILLCVLAGIAQAQEVKASDGYTNFVKLVQEQLHRQGFLTGPLDGELGGDTQAALAQFQLSRHLPVTGSTDEATLAALGVQREHETASAGASASEQASAPPPPQAE